MGINDREFQKIVPNFVETERAYEGIIRFWAQEIELMESMRDSYDTYNRVTPYQIAASNAELVRRKIFSDIGDLRQIYWSKLNKKKLFTPIDQHYMGGEGPQDLSQPFTFQNITVDSIDVNLPRQGGYQQENIHTPTYYIKYSPTMQDTKCQDTNPGHMQDVVVRPRFSQNAPYRNTSGNPGPEIDMHTIHTKHMGVSRTFHESTSETHSPLHNLPSTPAMLYYEAGVLLDFMFPVVKKIIEHYRNLPPEMRYEKNLITAGQLIQKGLVDTPAHKRFVKIRNTLKENFFPTLG